MGSKTVMPPNGLVEMTLPRRAQTRCRARFSTATAYRVCVSEPRVDTAPVTGHHTDRWRL